jgi:hypothetical protein
LQLKDPYNRLVESLPPYSDITFATLQIWWALSEQLMVSTLNGNLVINYHIPADEMNSGLSIIGREKLDDSIVTLFHYLKGEQRTPCLVHIPEFVVKEIKRREGLSIVEEPDYNEYLLDTKALSKLEGPQYQLLRKKIKRFIRTVADRELEMRTLDMTLADVQDEVFKSIAEWQAKNDLKNDPGGNEHKALEKTLKLAPQLGIEALGLYIDRALHGVVIYHRPLGKEYVVLHHLKADYETPYISDYIHHQIAKHAAARSVTKLNIEMDLGIENLRKHKLTLRPAGFFRKYTVTPAS